MLKNETAPAVMIPRVQPTGIINKQESCMKFNIDGTVKTIILPAMPPLPPSVNAQAEPTPLQPLYSNYSIPQGEVQDGYAVSLGNGYDNGCIQELVGTVNCYQGERYYNDSHFMPPSYDTRPIVNLDQFHIMKDGRAIGILDMSIVKYLIQHKHFFVIEDKPYVYEGGYYKVNKNGYLLKAEIQKLMYHNFITSYKVTSIYKLLISQPEVQMRFADVNKQPPYMINFLNGMYDVRANILLPHNPMYYSINQIPHVLDLNLDIYDISKYFNTVQFLQFALPERDDREMLFEYLGYAMTTDTQFQKFMVIKGPSDSGKSRIIKLFRAIIGDANLSSRSLHQLAGRFYATSLFGKLLNTCGDISSQDLHDVSIVKQATGEDDLTYEPKGVDGEDFLSYAKLLFSTNKPPRNKDEQSDAFYNRLLMLLMDQIPAKKDGELLNRIIPEIPYIILLAVNSLRNAYERGGLLESANSVRLVHKLRRDSDNVTAFCEDYLTPFHGGSVKTTEVRKAYEYYCTVINEAPVGRTKFYDALTEKGFRRRPQQGVDYFVDVKMV